jgi:CIC family chloride channel protein
MENSGPKHSAMSHPLRWFPEFLEFGRRRFRTQGRVLGAAILVGIVAGLGGVAFTLASQVVVRFALEGVVGYKAEAPTNEAHSDWIHDISTDFRPWLLLIVPTVGGLLSGFIVFRFAPEAEGHGTDAAIAAYHVGQGVIRPRVPLVKLIASALTIGTGGSGGREGPIAQIGAGFGSLLATLLKYRIAERRILLAAGMGAGIAAIFRAPLAGTIFAAEILYCSPEFEPEVILPAGLASVVSYCTFGVVMHGMGDPGDPFRTLFRTPELKFTSVWELGPYLLLAIWVAILSMLYVRTFYGVTHLFHTMRMPRMFKLAVGAFLTGLVAIGLYYATHESKPALSVLSFGYGILQDGLAREFEMTAGLLLAVAVGKVITTSLTIGSGGSGGVFGPSMVIGGCGGGALGVFLHQHWPDLVPHPATFVILGMAGFFAAAAKTPFSTLIIVSEMTGDYKLLMPTLWVVTIAFLVSDEEPLYRSQVKSRALSPAHQGSYVRAVLAGLKVSSFMLADIKRKLLRLEDNLDSVIDDLNNSGLPVLPVINDTGRLQGVVVLDEVHLATRGIAGKWLLAADLMRPDVEPLNPDDQLDRAMELFVEQDLLALPVVDDPKERRVIGLVRRSDVAQAYLRHVQGRRIDRQPEDEVQRG